MCRPHSTWNIHTDIFCRVPTRMTFFQPSTISRIRFWYGTFSLQLSLQRKPGYHNNIEDSIVSRGQWEQYHSTTQDGNDGISVAIYYLPTGIYLTIWRPGPFCQQRPTKPALISKLIQVIDGMELCIVALASTAVSLSHIRLWMQLFIRVLILINQYQQRGSSETQC